VSFEHLLKKKYLSQKEKKYCERKKAQLHIELYLEFDYLVLHQIQ